MTDKEKYTWSTFTISELLTSAVPWSISIEPATQEINRRIGMIDKLLNHNHEQSGECSGCGKIVCPFGEELHFHHDGCPSCSHFEPRQS